MIALKTSETIKFYNNIEVTNLQKFKIFLWRHNFFKIASNDTLQLIDQSVVHSDSDNIR